MSLQEVSMTAGTAMTLSSFNKVMDPDSYTI